MKVQVHGFSETALRYNQGPDALDESRLVMTFLTNLEITEILCTFRLVLEGKERIHQV